MAYTFEELQAVDPAGLFDFMQYMPETAKVWFISSISNKRGAALCVKRDNYLFYLTITGKEDKTNRRQICRIWT